MRARVRGLGLGLGLRLGLGLLKAWHVSYYQVLDGIYAITDARCDELYGGSGYDAALQPGSIVAELYGSDRAAELAGPMLLALPGVLMGTAFTGMLARLLYPEWSWNLCFLFGSMLSATDPVAVVRRTTSRL